MAKSTGNIARVADLVAAGVSPRALRYALIGGPLPGAAQLLGRVAAGGRGAAVERIDALLAALAAYREDRADDPELPAAAGRGPGRRSRRAWTTTSTSPRRWPPLFDGVRELNRRLDARTLSTADAGAGRRRWSGTWTRCSGIAAPADAALDPELQALLDERVAARAARDWAASDRLRDELLARGVAVEDTRDGQRWRHVVASGG